MQKIWRNAYPPQVPFEIDPTKYHNSTELFNEIFERYTHKTLTTCMGVSHTYAEVNEYARCVTAWLQSQGLRKGAMIAVMMPNLPQYLPILLGIIRGGFVCTPINPLYTGRELKHQLNDAGAETIFLVDNFAQSLEQVIDETPIKRVILSKFGDLMGMKGILVNVVIRQFKKLVPKYQLDSPNHHVIKFPTVLKLGSKLDAIYPSCEPNDLAVLQYTGGTTGLAKGAMLSHRNIIAAAMQMQAWYAPATRNVSTPYINMIMALPLYHIYAYMLTLMGMRSGYTFILVPNPRDMPDFVKTLAKQPFHILPGVNTLFVGLLKQPTLKNVDFSHLVSAIAGGMPANPQTAAEWKKATGTTLIEGWGMTEGVAIGIVNLMSNTEFNGKIGMPIPNIDISIRDENDKELGFNEPGELCFKGPNLMQGYYKKDNTPYFTKDGYFKTGDIVSIDETGLVTMHDRKKDMILVSGFNVFPVEVENIISECEGVAECAVIGVPDGRQGESIMAVVVRNNPELTTQTILDHCELNLTGYKHPRKIRFVNEIPKSAVGKILRNQIRDMVEKGDI